jgi:hypothetical protein
MNVNKDTKSKFYRKNLLLQITLCNLVKWKGFFFSIYSETGTSQNDTKVYVALYNVQLQCMLDIVKCMLFTITRTLYYQYIT